MKLEKRNIFKGFGMGNIMPIVRECTMMFITNLNMASYNEIYAFSWTTIWNKREINHSLKIILKKT